MSVQPLIRSGAPSLWGPAQEVDARRPRSLQARSRILGASDTACERRATYILHGTAPTDPVDKRAAILGTAIHATLLGAARTEYRWLVERSVRDDLVRGHVDAVQLDQATAARVPARHRPVVAAEGDGVIVEDVKTKSTWLWDKVLRYGATAAELRQVHLYAGILATRGFEDVPGQRYLARLGPLNVTTIRFRFVNRDNGAEHVQEVAYDPQRYTEARWWVERVLEYDSPEQARRSFDGPGLDAICDHCPFRTACWGEAPYPGGAVQANVVRDDADVATALAAYDDAHRRWTAAERDKKKARRMLDRKPPGVYGALQLGWAGGNLVNEPDVQRMVDLYEDAGLTVPMRPDTEEMIRNLKLAGLPIPERATPRTSPRSIVVRPAPSPDHELNHLGSPEPSPPALPRTGRSPQTHRPPADGTTNRRHHHQGARPPRTERTLL